MSERSGGNLSSCYRLPAQQGRQEEGLWKPEEMEWANDGESKGGVLAHLERLESQVNRSRENLEDLQRAQALESALGTKIHKLRCLRDELRAEVKQRQARVKASAASVEPDQTLEISEQEIAERRRENVKAILQAYRFTE